MKELWLNFKDENGKDKRVLVESEKFAIGRTPDNDLQFSLGNLSRQHAQIQRFADVFIVSDCGSSNGSTLNGEPLEKPVALKNGDILNLGEAIEINVEIPSEKGKNNQASPQPDFDDDEEEDDDEPEVKPASSGSTKSASASTSSGGSGWLLMAVPILMVLVLLGLGGVVLIVRNQGDDIGKNGTGTPIPIYDFETPTPTETATPTASPTSKPSGNSSPSSSPSITPISNSTVEPPKTPPTGEVENIKSASADFLSRISSNSSREFLLEKQVSIVSSQLSQLKGSSVLADNIKNAKKNSQQIADLAKSYNFKAQFLAVAALTKLDNQRGDVLATAREMAEKLSKIAKPFGSELADECLLVIAAYNGGISGEQLRKIAGSLKGSNAGEIRSIWFFKDKNKLKDADFNYAIKFLAIGAITQKPGDFNVSAEALVF